jgi:hypothetical protein
VLTTFGLSDKRYRLNQLRYDLRKLKGHGLLERDGTHYAYHLTTKGVEVALLFLFFHKRLCGPLANSRFQARGGLSSCRCSNPESRRFARRRLTRGFHCWSP